MTNVRFFPFLKTSLLNKKYGRVWERKRRGRERERERLKFERELGKGTKEGNAGDFITMLRVGPS